MSFLLVAHLLDHAHEVSVPATGERRGVTRNAKESARRRCRRARAKQARRGRQVGGSRRAKRHWREGRRRALVKEGHSGGTSRGELAVLLGGADLLVVGERLLLVGGLLAPVLHRAGLIRRDLRINACAHTTRESEFCARGI